jgi:predicted component of type VI protein secretion system
MPAEGRLEVVEGAQKGEVVALAASPVTLGRAPGNGWVVKDTTVSRQHAKVFERDERHFIADLNSSHGTFVNGIKITLHSLVPGDEVKLGNTTLRYFPGRAAPATPAAPPIVANAPSIPGFPPLAKAPPVTSAPPVVAPAEGDTFDLELEMPTSLDARPPAAAPPPPAPAKPLPPVNPNYRRALAATGEDPFADEKAPSGTEPSGAPAAAPAGKPAPAMPSIEMRGRTAEHFASRGSPTSGGAARASGSAAVHVPPPLARIGKRRRGPLALLFGDLDQRGGFARLVAAVFALAVAGGLLWITLRLIGTGPKAEAPRQDDAPLGPERPSLPQKKS